MKKILRVIIGAMLIGAMFVTPVLAKDSQSKLTNVTNQQTRSTTYGSAFKDFNTSWDTFQVNCWGSGVTYAKFQFNVYCYSGSVNGVVIQVRNPNGTPIKFQNYGSYAVSIPSGQTTCTLTLPLIAGNYTVEVQPNNTGNCRVICTIYK